MFATLVGPYPRSDGADAATARRDALEDQLTAGLGILADGRPTPDPDPLTAWRTTDEEARALAAERELELRPVKARLVGPYSAALARGRRGGLTARRREAMAAADEGRSMLQALFAAGAPIVQVEEDGLADLGADAAGERALAIDALVRLMDGGEGHVSLSIVGGDASGAGPEVCYAAPFSSHLFDLINGPDGWRVARQAPSARGLIVGVADCRPNKRDVEPVLVWGGRYAASMGSRGLERVGLAPSAGLESMSRDKALARIQLLARAAATAGLSDAELRRALPKRALSRGLALPKAARPRPSPDATESEG